MKRVIFMACLCATSFLCLGQRMSTGVLLDTMPDVRYINVVGVNVSFFKKKIVPIVDYGQKVSRSEGGAVLADANGEPLEFLSMAGVMNYLAKYGWELKESFAVSEGTSGLVYHYWLSRNKP